MLRAGAIVLFLIARASGLERKSRNRLHWLRSWRCRFRPPAWRLRINESVRDAGQDAEVGGGDESPSDSDRVLLDLSGRNIELEAEVQSLRDQLASQQGEDKRKLEEESEKARGLAAEVQSLRDQLASQQGEDKRKLEEESEKARGLEAEVQELKKWKDHDKQSLEVRPRRAAILARMSPNSVGMLSATTFPE